MKRVIKDNYKFILGLILGLIISITTVYAVDAYIESNKVAYNNHNKTNVEEAIDELYEKSGMHKSKWIDPVLNGADPVLKSPLIPVEIKNNGEVYYANENSEWYNYSEKRWANAIILIDSPSNTNYKVGDHIIEDDIESYFVWIPRYQYKVWTLANSEDYTNIVDGSTLTNENKNLYKLNGSERLIDIKFGSVEKVSKMNESDAVIDNYYTHPAFTLGNKDLNGIWVGKFETSGTNASNIIIKPNVISWRNQTVKVFFDAAKEYNKTLDSHMMKNTEWGAVAYLSHSGYGIGTELNINNTYDYITGYSAGSNTFQNTYPGDVAIGTDESKTQPWNTPVGYLASTSGNITGIYDMSGGAWEWVAACIDGTVGESGFDTVSLANEMTNGYIDKYPKDSEIISYNKRILGDAIGEMEPFYLYYDQDGVNRYHSSWYGDGSNFANSTAPWFYRGGYAGDGVLAGIFDTAAWSGNAHPANSFRLV